MTNQDFQFDDRLDVDFLQSIYDGDLEHAEMIFEKFLVSINHQLAEIDTCCVNHEVDNFRKYMHKMKPVLSYVGLTSFTERATVLENKCTQNISAIEIAVHYHSFKHDLKSMIPIVESDLNKIRSYN